MIIMITITIIIIITPVESLCEKSLNLNVLDAPRQENWDWVVVARPGTIHIFNNPLDFEDFYLKSSITG